MTKTSWRDYFNRIIHSDDTPDYIKNLFSICIEQNVSDFELLRLIYDFKDNLSDELSKEFEFYLKDSAPLKWFMLLITVYEEKIDNTMKYVELIKRGYLANLNVGFIDDCLKYTPNFSECEKVIMDEIKKNKDVSEVIEEDEIIEVSENDEEDIDSIDNVSSIEINHLKNVNKSLKKMLDEHMEELDNLQTEIFSLKKEIYTYKSDITSYESKVDSLTKENKGLSLNNRMIENRIKNLQNQCNILKKINEELTQSADEIDDNRIIELENQIEELKQENNTITTDKKEVERKYQELYVEHMDLTAKYNDLEESYKKNKVQLSAQNGNNSRNEAPKLIGFDVQDNSESVYMDINAFDSDIDDSDDDIDYDIADVKSMIPDEKTKQEILEHRSLFVKLFNKFKDREFTRMPLHEQKGKIFTRMMSMDFPKDTIKLVSSTLNSNKDKVSLELYHMIERNATPEECEMYCKSVNAA